MQEPNRMGGSISVGIVNFNTREEVEYCLNSPGFESAHVIVLDNASSDGSVELVARKFPSVIVLACSTNHGFGKGANELIRQLRTDYVLLLNSDTRVEKGALEHLSHYLDAHPKAAIVGPRLTNRDESLQPSCYPFPGTLKWLIDNDVSCSALRYLPGVRNRLLRCWPHNADRVVPWVKGAALAIRRAAFQEVGGFDESFFMYFEETDLCQRLQKAGWEVRFAPVATIAHVGAASTDQCRTDMLIHLIGGNFRFYQKHYSLFRCVLLSLLWRGVISIKYVVARLRVVGANGACALQTRQELAAWGHLLRGWRWLAPELLLAPYAPGQNGSISN